MLSTKQKNTLREMYLVGYLNEVTMTHSSFEEEFEEI